MKSFTTLFVAAAVGLAGAAAVTDPLSVVSSESATAPVSSASASTIITTPPTIPTTTGGFVVAGVYTTCLTVTFGEALNTTSTAIGSASSLPAGTTTPVVTSEPAVTSFTGSEVTIPTGSASGPIVTTLPTTTATDVAVFTTCLVFLPTPTLTVTSTGTGLPPIGSESASFSVPPPISATTVA
ncbi:hypothetical protein C8R46DRAFT_1349461 [Mycena filopes]|nr:hypothetical protein C8R46DRAFT_1349461 [Mycena filopes]